ncbi:MAG: transposase [Patescibacteria group bacterium]
MSRQQHIHQEEFPYLLTTIVRNRAKFFREEKWARELSVIIRRACVLHKFSLLAYAIMPDHLHLIVYPNQAQASVPASLEIERAGRDARAGRAYFDKQKAE